MNRSHVTCSTGAEGLIASGVESFIARTPLRSLAVRFGLSFVQEVRAGDLRQALNPKAPFRLLQLEYLLPTASSSVLISPLTRFSAQPPADDRFVIENKNGDVGTGSSVGNSLLSIGPLEAKI